MNFPPFLVLFYQAGASVTCAAETGQEGHHSWHIYSSCIPENQRN